MKPTTLTSVDVVKNYFSLFKSGNIAALLNELEENVRWSTPQPNELPWGGDREGKYAVGHFFSMLKENVEFRRFEPLKFISQGNIIVALGYSELRIKENQKEVSVDWAMIFTLNEEGRISRFQEYSDTYDIVAAMPG